jgi:hypothetical protein
MVEASLREVGAGRSIVTDKDGRVIAGNKTLEAAADIGLKIRVVETTGQELVVVQRNDLDLSDDTGPARKLAYYDNRAGETGLAWDAEVLLADLNNGVDLSGMFNADELDVLLDGLIEKEPMQPAEAQTTEARKTLAERFIIPPFSVLDARQGYWQERKRAWIALGIQSELGRGEAVTWGVAPSGQGTGENSDKAYTDAARKVSPGGSPRDAATLGKDGRTVRGDGKGKPLGGGQAGKYGNA